MTQGDDLPKVGHPIQRVDKELYKDAGEVGKGMVLTPEYVDVRSPAAMMRQMGFDPTSNMTPLQFLLAVMNDNLDMLFKSEKRRNRYEGKGGIAMSYRLEAAKTAAKYLHMQLPSISVVKDDTAGNFGGELAAAIAAGEKRITSKTLILETVDEVSPDAPLAPASYPPSFASLAKQTGGDIVDADAYDADEILPDPAGDTDYDPDNE